MTHSETTPAKPFDADDMNRDVPLKHTLEDVQAAVRNGELDPSSSETAPLSADPEIARMEEYIKKNPQPFLQIPGCSLEESVEFIDHINRLIAADRLIATVDVDGEPFHAVNAVSISGQGRLIVWLQEETCFDDGIA